MSRLIAVAGSSAVTGVVYGALILLTLVPGVVTMLAETQRSPLIQIQAIVIAVGAAVLLWRSATVPHFSLAWSMFWMWVYVFLGLAPLYQLATDTFPWLGEFDDRDVQVAQLCVIVGCVALLLAGTWMRWGRESRDYALIGLPTKQSGRSTGRVISTMLVLYCFVAAAFIVLMGESLFQGKSILQAQLAANEHIPGSGSLFFIATAGAIVLPAVAIVARRNGISVSIPLIALSVIFALVVTNPLTGSRFLTGSTWIAVLAAVLVRRSILRLAPAGVGTLLVTVFPSLDIWRGDGTGSDAITLTMPSNALVSFDFDSFELLIREVSLRGAVPDSLPSRFELFVAPFLRWIPGLSNGVQGDDTGRVVAHLSGMSFTNVSMPLWGESHFVAGFAGVVIAFAALGAVLAMIRPSRIPPILVPLSRTRLLLDAPVAALLMIVLRGALYEVMGYLLLALSVGVIIWLAERAHFGRPMATPAVASVASPLPRARTVAFYLPQFHTIPENDDWWGKGFTEWANVARATPQFDGHAHPRRPADLGEYDLKDVAVMYSQAALAKAHDVDAFCFYFYSFGDKRLLEKPLNNYLRDGPDFPFCISWANESWSRRWDGKAQESLISQVYSASTAADIFDSFLPYLQDERYLRVDGAAVIVVHRADQLPGASAYADVWRTRAREAGVGEIHLIAAETKPDIQPVMFGFDAVCEFPPVGSNTLSAGRLVAPHGLNPAFSGRIMSFPRLVRMFTRRREPGFTRYRGVAPGWDNTARRQSAATIYADASPYEYRKWLVHAREYESRARGSDGLVFINAWNEWAEGAYLEPDELNGSGYLEMTSISPEGQPLPPAALRPGFGGLPQLHSLALVGAGTVLQFLRRLKMQTMLIALRSSRARTRRASGRGQAVGSSTDHR